MEFRQFWSLVNSRDPSYSSILILRMFLELLIASSVLAAHCPVIYFASPVTALFNSSLFFCVQFMRHSLIELLDNPAAYKWLKQLHDQCLDLEQPHEWSHMDFHWIFQISWTKPLKMLHMLLQHCHRKLHGSDLHSYLSESETPKCHEFSHSAHSFSK